MATILSDRPIDIPNDDLLGRDSFAKAIADMIINAPENGSLRIGVFGGWGDGKTSILKLVSNHLRIAGQVCIWIVPWIFSNREEVIDHLFREIANELEISTKEFDSAKRDFQIAEELHETVGSDLKLKLADILIYKTFKRYVDKKVNAKGQTLISAIGEKLENRRLTIFIDDLDRVRPNMVPDLLLTLREALDCPNYFYVMALAPDVVERGLGMVHKAWGEPRQFLEKIIELPMYIPELTSQHVELYAEALINSLGTSIDQEVIKDLIPLLPKNPRRLKLFLRYLASLHGLLSRFDSYEVDWGVLYMCLMLRFEFPESIRKLARDEKAVADIEAGYVKKISDKHILKNSQKDEVKEELPEYLYAPNGEEEHKHFLRLCNAIRERGVFRGRYRLPKLFKLADEPPVITFKEIDDVISKLSDLQAEKRLDELRQWLTTNNYLEMRKAQAFVDGLVELRNSHLDSIVNADLEEDLKGGLRMASLMTIIIRYVAIDLGGFKNGILNSENWLIMFRHFARWAHFSTFDYYKEVREEEHQLLEDTLADMSISIQSQILEARELDPDFPFEKHPEPFEKVVQKIHNKLEVNVSDRLIETFETPDGLESFWAIEFHVKGKHLLFNDKSQFHKNNSYRARLKEISLKAKKNSDIQRNFLTYFRMLYYGGYKEGGSFPRSECQALLKDHELLKLIWEAAVAQPLNPRMAGSLYRDRHDLIKQGIPEDLLPTPRWWERIEKAGFFPSA